MKFTTASGSVGGKDILSAVSKYYSEFFRCKDHCTKEEIEGVWGKINMGKEGGEEVNLCDPVSMREIDSAIDELLNGKSPGMDGLSNEFYKSFKKEVGLILELVYNDALTSGILPKSFKDSILVLLYKKGSKEILSNYRPIMILNTDYKILAKILNNRLKKIADSLLCKAQNYAIPGRNIYHSLAHLREMVTATIYDDVKFWILSLDQEKAFDRVSHKFLYETLSRLGIQDKFIHCIMMLYKDAVAFPLVNGHVGSGIPLSAGVKQGCPLSPLLYAFSLEPLIRLLSTVTPSLKVNALSCSPITVYADDITVVFNEQNVLDAVVSQLELYSNVAGSKVNYNKSKIIWFGKGQPSNVSGSFQVIKNSIKLLGVEFSGERMDEHNWQGVIDKVRIKLEQYVGYTDNIFTRVQIIKTYILPLCLNIAVIVPIPTKMIPIVNSLLYSFIWGSKLARVRRSITYNKVSKGGLNMVNVEVFFGTLFFCFNLKILLGDSQPDWVGIFYARLRPWLMGWENGDIVRKVLLKASRQPVYVIKLLKMMNHWSVLRSDVLQKNRKIFYQCIISSFYSETISLEACPPDGRVVF